jgi:nitrogen fixation-related uncharacterized protein
MTLAYLVIFASFVLFAVSVVFALGWAMSHGQMQDFQQGATAIFDPDEPLGTRTDSFPGSATNGEPPRERSHE